MTPDVLVLRRGTHGTPSTDYAAELRDRLPGREVVRARTPTEERELVVDAPVVTGFAFEEPLLDRAERLRLFAAGSAGVDHLPLAAFEDRGVAVTNASGVHGPNVAEHVLGCLLTFARNLHEGWRRQRRSEWRHFQAAGELQGSTATVVGLGPIGQAVVERLDAFGVTTLGVRHSPEKGGPTDEVYGYDDDLHDAFARSDALVLACPLTETTRGLVDDAAFETLPPAAVLVNVARGPVVDTDALVAALRKERVRGAALDVTDPEPLPADHPLWTLENCLVTPHAAGHTPRYYERLADVVAPNAERVLDAVEREESAGGEEGGDADGARTPGRDPLDLDLENRVR